MSDESIIGNLVGAVLASVATVVSWALYASMLWVLMEISEKLTLSIGALK